MSSNYSQCSLSRNETANFGATLYHMWDKTGFSGRNFLVISHRCQTVNLWKCWEITWSRWASEAPPLPVGPGTNPQVFCLSRKKCILGNKNQWNRSFAFELLWGTRLDEPKCKILRWLAHLSTDTLKLAILHSNFVQNCEYILWPKMLNFMILFVFHQNEFVQSPINHQSWPQT